MKKPFRLCALFLSLCAILPLCPAPALADNSLEGLVVWYDFEERGESVKDLSGHNNHARLVGNPVWTDGKSGSAMFFDGNGAHLNCGNDKSLRRTSDFTLSFWVKADAQPDWYATVMSWDKNDKGQLLGWALYAGLPAAPGNPPSFHVYSPSWALPGYGPGIDTNQWQHICITLDKDNNGVFYIDGEPHKKIYGAKTIISHDGDLVIGQNGMTGVNYRFRGAIDDFRLYARTLTAPEVRGLHDATAAAISSPRDIALRDAVVIQPATVDYSVLQWGKNTISVRCALPETLRKQGVQLQLSLQKDGREILRQDVPVADDKARNVTLNVPEVEPGQCLLLSAVRLPDGRLLKESRQYLQVCRKLVTAEKECPSLEPGDLFVFDEFAKFLPPQAISKTTKKHSWYLQSYRLRDGTPARHYLAADGLVHIIRHTLPLKGRFAVYLGLLNPGKGLEASLGKRRMIRRRYAPQGEPPAGATVIEDCFFTYARMTGNEVLTLNAPSDMTPNGLAYIKFLRLTDSQVELVDGKNDISNQKKYIFYNDGQLFIFRDGLSAETIAEDVTHYKRKLATLDTFALTAGASVMYYNTKVGTVLGPYPSETAAFASNVQQVEALRRFLAEGNDSLAIAATAARKNGIKLEANLRMNWHYPDKHPWNNRLRNEHPEFRLLARPTASLDNILDYFHPEVREERYRQFEEIATTYDVHAITMDFTRWPIFFGIAAAESFEKNFGRKPGFSDPDDWEWFRYRARFMTDLVRRLRKMLDAHEKATGKRVELWAMLTSRHSLRQGLDVETWIKDGLINAVIPGTDWVDFVASDISVKPFVEMARNTNCKVYVRLDLYLGLAQHDWPSENRVKSIFWTYFQQGADGAYLFNMAPFRSPDLYRNLERWSVFEDSDKAAVTAIRLPSAEHRGDMP